jgi:hypothetical protein
MYGHFKDEARKRNTNKKGNEYLMKDRQRIKTERKTLIKRKERVGRKNKKRNQERCSSTAHCMLSCSH